MSVEGLFRDGKSRHNGQSLRHTRIGSPDRFDRSLLVVALAYILLAGLGLAAKLDHDPSAWCTNRRARECSASTIGKAVFERFNYSSDHLLQMIRRATIEVGSRWG